MSVETACRQIFEQYTKLGGIINRTKNEIQGQINRLKNSVENLVEIPQLDLDDLLGGINSIDVQIPTVLGSAEKDVLKCLVGSNKPGSDLSKIDDATDWLDLPFDLLQKYVDQTKGFFDDTLGSVLDTIPMGQAGDLLGMLDKAIKSTGLNDILNKLDALLACLNAGCSVLYPGTPDYAGDLRTSLGLTGTNEFNTSIFSTWNPTGNVASQLSSVTSSVRTKATSISNLTLTGL